MTFCYDQNGIFGTEVYTTSKWYIQSRVNQESPVFCLTVLFEAGQ